MAIIGNGEAVRRPVAFTKTYWPKFAELVEERVTCSPPRATVAQLERAVVALQDCLQQAITDASRTVNKPFSKTDIPEEIRQVIRVRNQARRAWQRHCDLAARASMHRLTREIRESLRTFRNERWSRKLESLETQDNSLWHMQRILRGNKKPTIPPILGARGMAYSDEAKAEAFADSLELQCSPNYRHADLDFIEEVEEFVECHLEETSDSTPIYITAVKVEECIRQLPLRKAPGPDGIPNIALRHLQRKGLAALTNIINAALQLRYFPRAWKIADVVMIAKPQRNRTFPQNYRPISLLPTLGKLFEKLIMPHIQSWLDRDNIIPDLQHGFRESHSTCHQLLRVTEFIDKSFNWKNVTAAIFLDVDKAFDKVWHQGLVYKLIKKNAPCWLVHLLTSYLKDRTFCVKVGVTRSAMKNITAGVPQGSVLSPVLFNIYTHDIPAAPRNSIIAQYADDTALITRSKIPSLACDMLQTMADEMQEWYAKWRIHVNATKSSAVMFTARQGQARVTTRNITMFDEAIPWKKEAKYLGVILDSKLNWNAHTTAVVNKTRAAHASLHSMMCRRSSLSIKNKLLLYTSVLRPMMVYAAPIWGFAGGRVLQKLQTTQNIILRMAVDAPWYVRNSHIHRDLGIPSIEDHVRPVVERFFATATSHENPLIAQAGDCYEDTERTRRKRARFTLHNAAE